MSLVGFCDRVSTIKVPIGTVTAPYGSIDSVHVTPHTGIDLYCPIGTKLFAPLDGVVSKIEDYGDISLGRAVFIRLDDGRQYVFGHLSEFGNIHVGQVIHKGDLIGISGSTGRSTGGHLHFGAYDVHGHFIDPETLFESVKSNFTLWIHKVVALSSESRTAFVTDPAIVSFAEPTNVLFKFFDVATHVI